MEQRWTKLWRDILLRSIVVFILTRCGIRVYYLYFDFSYISLLKYTRPALPVWLGTMLLGCGEASAFVSGASAMVMRRRLAVERRLLPYDDFHNGNPAVCRIHYDLHTTGLQNGARIGGWTGVRTPTDQGSGAAEPIHIPLCHPGN